MSLTKNINLIVAVQKYINFYSNNGIQQKEWGLGFEGKIPWKAPSDMAFFKKITSETKNNELQNAIIMGRKTFESIGKRLPNRINYVVTRNNLLKSESKQLFFCTSLEEALIKSTSNPNVEKVFVIGGSEIYHQVLKNWEEWIESTFLTEIENFSYSRYFPEEIVKICFTCDQFLDKKLFFDHHFEFSKKEIKDKLKDGTVCVQTFYEFKGINKGEDKYLDLIRRILKDGIQRKNRTGINTISLFGERMVFDITQKIPFLTTKRLAWKTMLRELLFFISGKTDNKILQKQGVHIWDGNSSKEYLDNIGLKDRKEGDLGPIYGAQWRHFGADYIDCDTDYSRQGIDQLAEVVRLIKEEPDSRRIIMSAWNPEALPLMALPPCFTGKTLVLTFRGYTPIKEVTKNDLVLSHLGNWKTVSNVHITKYSGKLNQINVSCHPNVIETTPEHPFYCRIPHFSSPCWIKAQNLTNDFFIGFPINQKNIIPNFNGLSLHDKKHWFFLGYYLAKGWISLDHQGEIYLLINAKVSDIVLEQLSFLNFKKITEGIDCVYHCSDIIWWGILKQYTIEKQSPEWIHDAPKDFLLSFSSGFKISEIAPNVLPSIGFTMQRIASKLGYILNLETNCSMKNSFYMTPYVGTNAYIKDSYVWYRVQGMTTRKFNGLVYNLEVSDDNSFVIENLAVHNCHMFSQWYIRKGKFLDCQMYQRSGDIGLGVPFNIASYSVLTYMLAHICDLTPGKFIHILGDAHIYENHLEAVKEQITRIPFQFPTLRFSRKITDIDDFKESDFIVENYQCHKNMDMKMVI